MTIADGGGASSTRQFLTTSRTLLQKAVRGDDERSRTQRRALAAFAIRVASAAIAYAMQVVLARWMGSFEYGVFVYVWVWVLVFGGLAPLGLNTAVIRFIPEHREKGEWGLLRGILLQSRLIAVAVSTGLAALAGLALYLAPGIVGSAYLLPAYLMLFCLPAYGLTTTQDCIGRGFGWINLGLIPPFILRPFLLLTAMVVAHYAGAPMLATTAAVCAIIATWLAGLIQLVLMERRIGKDVKAAPRERKTMLWLATALPILLIEGFELLLQNTDVMVIAHFMQASDAGVYFAALKTISLVSFVHFAVGSAVAHKLSAMNARGDQAALRAYVRDGARWTFWPSLAGALGLLILGKPLLAMFGHGFADAYGVMLILAVGLVFRATMGPAEFVLNMLGQQKLTAAVLFATAGLNLALNIWLVPKFGLDGAATATSTCLVTSSLLFYIAARRRLDIDISVWARPQYAASSQALNRGTAE